MGSTFDYTPEERQRDVVAGLYNKFHIDDVISDLTVSIGDETDEVITVTCALVDPDGDNVARRTVIKMVLFADDAYDDVLDAALADITYAATTGTLLPADLMDPGTALTGRVLYFVTDENGDLVFTITDAGGAALTAAMGFFLPNGQFVPGGEFAFAA